MPNATRWLTVNPADLPATLFPYWKRLENVQFMRTARLGLSDGSGNFGGPDCCRTVLRNCEEEMVSRPLPWPWEAR
jgi:hypothetical protein